MAENHTNRFDSTRRKFISRAAGCAVVVSSGNRWLAAQNPAKADNPKSIFRATEFNHLALDTPRPEEAITFYESKFGMTNISHGRTVRDTFLHFEKGFMNLGKADSAGLNHFCLGIEDYNPDIVFRMLSLLDLKPFMMGGNNLHILDPDGLNVQIQEIGHGYGRVDPTELTQAKKGLFETNYIHHLSLTVTDIARSKDFYTEMFGLKVILDNKSNRCVLAVGPGFMELRKGAKASMNHFCLAVKNVDASEMNNMLKNAGVDKVAGNESLVSLHDSSGLVVQVIAAK